MLRSAAVSCPNTPERTKTCFFYYTAVAFGISFVAALLMPDLRRKGFPDGSGELKC